MGYTVKAGESWESIAGKLMGDQRQFAVIAAANGWKDLKPGMVINIPGKVSNPVVTEVQMQRANQTSGGVQYGGGTQKIHAGAELPPPPTLGVAGAGGWNQYIPGEPPKTLGGHGIINAPVAKEATLPTTWNYKTATVNQQGESLPQPVPITSGLKWADNLFNSVFNRQAVGWTPQGTPYYGTSGVPGLAGYGTGVTEWAAGLANRVNTSMMEAQPTQAVVGTGINKGVDVNALVPSPIFGVGKAAATAVKEVALGLGTEALRLPIEALKRTVGTASLTVEQLGGAAQLVESQKPTDPGPLYKWMEQNSPGVNAFLVRLSHPETTALVASRAITNPMPIQEKWSVAKTALEASRMAFTASAIPMRLEEFKKELDRGADPYLLAKQLESPGIELLGELIYDPLNLLIPGGHAAQATEMRTVAQIANDAVPEIADVMKLGAPAEAITKGEKLMALRTAVNDALPAALARVRTGVGKMSEDTSLWALTTNGMRDLVGDSTADIVARAITANGPDRGTDVLTVMYKLASDNPADRLEAVDALAKLNMGTLPYSERGLKTSIMLRDALAEGPDKFIKAIQEAQKSADPLSEILNVAQKVLDPAIEKAFPTVTERVGAAAKIEELVAAGKEVPAHLAQWAESAKNISPIAKTLMSWDKAAKGPYLVINRFFASVYMGMSPAYAFRNMLQDTFVMFVDYPGMFTQGIGFEAWAERGAKWGRLPKSATEAFGALGAVEGLGTAEKAQAAFSGKRAIQDIVRNPFGFAREWSAGGEAKRAGAVVGYVVDREMARVVRRGGAAIPDIAPILKAGIPRETADFMVNLLIDNYGDVNKAKTAFMDAVRAGNAEAWRSVSTLLDAKTVENLRGFGLFEVVQDALSAGSREEAVAKVAEGFKVNVYDHAAAVAKETTGVPRGHEMFAAAANMGEARKAGYITDEAVSLAQMQWMANSHAMDAYAEALPPLLRRMYGEAVLQGQKDPQIVASANAIMGEVDKLLQSRRMNAAKEANAIVDQAWAKTRAIRKADGDVADLWRTYGFAGEMPSDIVDRRGLLDYLWDVETKPNQAKAYFAAVDDYNRVSQQAVQQMMDLTGYRPKVDELQRLAEAERLTRNAQEMRVATITPNGPVLDAAGALTLKNEALDAEYKALNDKLWNPQTQKPELEAIRKRMAEIDNALRPAITEKASTQLPLSAPAKFTPQNITEPPVPDGHIRLYRGEGTSSGAKLPEWAKANAGQWYSTKRAKAETFAAEQNRQLLYVDVPKEELAQYAAPVGNAADEYLIPKVVTQNLSSGTIDRLPVTQLSPPYSEGAAPSRARVMFESQSGVKALEQSVIDKINTEWGNVRGLQAGPGADAAVNSFFSQAAERINESLAVAQDVGVAAREFTLHNYAARHNFDTALSYIYPYQFWYTRTYTKWLKRLVQDPVLLADYTKYRSYLEKIHSNLPDFYKYSLNSNDLPGIHADNPLFFNLEQTINPLNGVTGVDFNDAKKRVNWWTSAIDDLGKFGPSIWTPFSAVVATALALQGDKEAAAKWAGRLIPQTGALRAGLSLITGGNVSALPLRGEYDPFVHLFGGGQEPYEMARTARALGMLVQQGAITEAQADDAARSHQGPVWDQAVNLAVGTRAPWQIVSFLGGTGFKGRTKEDMQIDQFYGDYNKLWTMEPNLSPDEFRRGMDQLHQQYPYMDALLISRKGGPDRDRGFAYAVLGRIPPGGSSKYAEWAHIDPALIDKFYTSKGHMETWATADQQRFMAGVADLAAVLDIPPDATKQEWTEAKDRYYKVLAIAEQQFGTDIWARADAYMAARGSSAADNAKANAILAGDPAIGQALDLKQAYIVGDPLLVQYYGGLSKIEGYFKGLMYNDIEKQLGTDVWDQWSEYDAQGSAAEKRAYWNSHPDLKRYMTIRDNWAPVIGEKIVEYASKLHDVPVAIRTDIPGGLGQEQLLSGIQGQQVGLPQLSWPQWQAQLGGSLSNLVADYALQGDVLPKSAITQLDNVATQMGLTNGYVVLNLAAQAARVP